MKMTYARLREDLLEGDLFPPIMDNEIDNTKINWKKCYPCYLLDDVESEFNLILLINNQFIRVVSTDFDFEDCEDNQTSLREQLLRFVRSDDFFNETLEEDREEIALICASNSGQVNKELSNLLLKKMKNE